MAGTDLPMKVLIDMISSAVHLIIQITRFADGKRRVTYITEITGKTEDGLGVSSKDIFRYHQVTMNEAGQSIGFFSGCDYAPSFHKDFKLLGLLVPDTLYESEAAKAKKAGLPTPEEQALKNAPVVPAGTVMARSGH